MAIMNNLFFDIDNEHPSVCWEKDNAATQLLCQLWLLEKYKDNKEIVSYIININIKKSIKKCKYEYGTEIYDKIMNKVSYETLNKDDKEKKMKNLVMGGLVLCLLMGFAGCKEEPAEEIKTVDPIYLGEYWDIPNPNVLITNKLLVREKEIILTSNAIDKDDDIRTTVRAKTYAAYTEKDGPGISLYYDRSGDGKFTGLGAFLDENTIQINMIKYYRQ